MGEGLAEGRGVGNVAVAAVRAFRPWMSCHYVLAKAAEDMPMDLPDPLITSDDNRMGGTPVFAGTRVPVKTLFEFLEDGAPLSEFLSGFPNVTREHAIAVLELAQNRMLDKITAKAAAE